MNSKKIIVLGVLLALVVVIIVLVKTIGNRAPADLAVFPGATAKTVSAVSIRDAATQVKLQRRGNAWFMIPKEAILPAGSSKTQGLETAMGKDGNAPVSVPVGMTAAEFPADSSALAQLFDNITVMRKTTMVSENPENQAMFEVDSLRGISVTVIADNGKPLGAVILGKNGPDYNSIYARSPNTSAVYLMLDVARFAFSADNNRWSDKTIMKFDKATAKEITIAKKGEDALSIAKSDSSGKGWVLTAPPGKGAEANQLDSAKVDEVLTGLSSLTAAEYEYAAQPDTVTGLTDPQLTITIAFAGGTTRSVIIGNLKPGQTKFYAKIPDKPYLFLINDFDQKKFDKKAVDLEKQPENTTSALQNIKKK